jgi:hypothetical protein
MIRRQSIFVIVMVALLGTEIAQAQLHGVRVFGDYSVGSWRRLSTTRVQGWGGGVELRYQLTPNFGINLQAGYALFSIDQPDAIEQWNWDFWIERYKGNIQATLQSDPNLSAVLTPEQVLEATPVALTLSAELPVMDRLVIGAYGGGGIYFFTKKLYIKEDWKKYYPEADYTFQYSYLNFANPKPGSPWTLVGGIEARYRLSSMFELNGAFRGNYMVRTKGRRGYENLPFRLLVSGVVSLTILYN